MQQTSNHRIASWHKLKPLILKSITLFAQHLNILLVGVPLKSSSSPSSICLDLLRDLCLSF